MIGNTLKMDVNAIEILSLNTLMKQQKWNSKSLHHICGKCNADKFNVNEPENKIIITQKTHDAINNLFGTSQSPKEQLLVMLDLWDSALSKDTKRELIDILSKSDRTFYLRKLVKG